jgi:hypothetical protein
MTFNRFLVLTLLLATPTLASADVGPKPGAYECRVDKGYKFRPCTVRLDQENVSHLEFSGGLVGLKGRFSAIQDSKKDTFFEGNLSEKRPFGCGFCAERCSETGANCMCSEVPSQGTAECIAQPMNSVMAKKGNGWKGILPQRMYSVEYETLKPGQKPVDRAVIGYSYDILLHSLEIRQAKQSRAKR